MRNNVYLVSGAGIWTNNVMDSSLLPLPLDQGSGPRLLLLFIALFCSSAASG